MSNRDLTVWLHGAETPPPPSAPVPKNVWALRDTLLRKCRELAERVGGAAAIDAMVAATDGLWDSGGDLAYAEIIRRDGVTAENAETFHCTWLSLLAADLETRCSKQNSKAPCPECEQPYNPNCDHHWHIDERTILSECLGCGGPSPCDCNEAGE